MSPIQIAPVFHSSFHIAHGINAINITVKMILLDALNQLKKQIAIGILALKDVVMIQ